MGTEDQRTEGTEDRRNSGYIGPVEQWIQRTSGAVGTEDQGNSGLRRTVGTEN